MNEVNETATQILERYSQELHSKVNLFYSVYHFWPSRPGTHSFEGMNIHEKTYSLAFFSHKRVQYLEARIADWSEQCHLLKSSRGN